MFQLQAHNSLTETRAAVVFWQVAPERNCYTWKEVFGDLDEDLAASGGSSGDCAANDDGLQEPEIDPVAFEIVYGWFYS